jgi:putative spermidine/putrescine transport system permease protein
MNSLGEHAGRFAGHVFLVIVCMFMLAPVVVVVLVSLSPTAVFDIPTNAVSLRWYAKLADVDELWSAIRLSIEIGGIATFVSLLLGTLCALGLQRARFRCRNCFVTFVMSPMMLPGIVIGIAMLTAFRRIGLVDGFVSLLLAHIVLTLPYVVRVLYGALGLFDFRMVEAARTLGLGHARALVAVLVPNVFPSFLTAGMFAFLTSVDNYALALFLGDVHNVTLPIQILKFLDRAADPTIAAVASLMVIFTALVLLAAERLVGTKRLIGG